MLPLGVEIYLILTIALVLCSTAFSSPSKEWPNLIVAGFPFRMRDKKVAFDSKWQSFSLDHQRIDAFLQAEEKNTPTHTASREEGGQSLPGSLSSKKYPRTQANYDSAKSDQDEVHGKYDDALDGLLRGNTAADRHISSSKLANTVQSENPTKTTENGIEQTKEIDIDAPKFYCHHVNSCGVRTLRGPSSVDSVQNGVECACKGVAENGHVGMCFHGKCYNRKSGQKRRDDNDLDAHGLCEYSASDIAPTSLCDLKEQEKSDPNTYYFSDNGLSAHLEKQD